MHPYILFWSNGVSMKMCRDASHPLLSLLILFVYLLALPSIPIYFFNLFSCFLHFFVLINPQRMREGYGSRSVCLSVCYRASCYIPRLYVEIQVSLGFLCWSSRMYCVDFVENALFKSSGEICWSPRCFLASGWTLDGQKRQRWPLFEKTSM